MARAIERLTECIGRAVRHAQFRSVYGNWFESPVMRKFYARKMRRGVLPVQYGRHKCS